MRSGFVSLVGRPNVGKSTLINALVGYKIAITSNKAQTTRNNIQGIYNTDGYQMIFVDTPGMHKPKHKLGKYMNEQSYDSTIDVDVILSPLSNSKVLLGKTSTQARYYAKTLKELSTNSMCIDTSTMDDYFRETSNI